MAFVQTVLAIESSCDETAASLITGRYAAGSDVPEFITIHSHVVESQTASHLPFGGVVPEVAARDHLAKIDSVVKAALAGGPSPDVVAATAGPGLIGALMVGLLYARGFALSAGKPLMAINHVDAHLAPALLLNEFAIGKPLLVPRRDYPALALTVSGGHCHLSLLEAPLRRRVLGRSTDDACGEAFDKVAKLLGLPYPGGPHLERLAREPRESGFQFPATLADRTNRLGFSYSGLKTSVLYAIRKLKPGLKGRMSGADLPDVTRAALAHAFQEAALGQLEDRIRNAIHDLDETPRALFVAGGVAANGRFREKLATLNLPVSWAPLPLCADNATMIGLHALLHGRLTAERLRQANLDGFTRQAFTRYDEGTP